MSIFAALDVYHDESSRTAALNMAIDEALLETAALPTIRFYRWDHPALSFGYFGKFADVENSLTKRDIVRRWTGGGIVLHGDDLTYSIVIPASDAAFNESSMSIYEKVHSAIQTTLGSQAELAAVAAVSDRRDQKDPAIGDRRYNNCFANPVRADVLLNGRKIAGAAQRRTRRGLLQQGSIQGLAVPDDLEKIFSAALSTNPTTKTLTDSVLQRAQEIADQKYGSAIWLRRR